MTARLDYPTEREIRHALIQRMEAFCAAAGIAPSMVCREVMNDTSFFAKIVSGGNFTVATYQRIQSHLSKHWPRGAPIEPKRAPAKRTNGKRRNGSA